MICSKCGKENEDQSVFCENCGNDLKENEYDLIEEVCVNDTPNSVTDNDDEIIEVLDDIIDESELDINIDEDVNTKVDNNINININDIASGDNPNNDVVINELSGDNSEKQKRKKTKGKKGNKLILLLIIIVLLVVSLAFYFVFFNKKSDNSGSSDNTEDNAEDNAKDENLLYDDFTKIIDEYAEQIEKVVNDYTEKNDVVPAYSDIEANIKYDKYPVSCDTIYINYDATIFLTGCSIKDDDSDEEKTSYEYGEKKEDVIQYIYKEYYNNDLVGYYASKSQITEPVNNKNYELIGTYKCLLDECLVYKFSVDENSGTLMVYDKANYIYNYKDNKKQKTKLENKKYNEIGFDKNLNGYLVDSTENTNNFNAQYQYNYYDPVRQKMIFDNSYSKILTLSSGYIITETELEKDKMYQLDFVDYNSLTNIKTRNSEISLNYIMFDSKKIGNQEIMIQSTYNGNYLLLDNKFNDLISDTIYNNYAINSDYTITVSNLNKFYIYDINGKKQYESDAFTLVVAPVEDYVIVDKDNEVKILDKKGEDVVTLFTKSENLNIMPAFSGRKEEKIFVKCSDNDIPEGTMGAGVQYVYYLTTKNVEVLKDSSKSSLGTI